MPWPNRFYNPSGINVYDNLIINSGLNAGVKSTGSNDIFITSRFERNEYTYNDINGQRWMWDDRRGDKTYWQSRDQDPNGALGKP